MTRATEAFPNAFAVRFKDLDRWDPASFQPIVWHWPKEIMVPVGSVLLPRRQPVDRTRFAFSDLQPVTIHFDGSIERRDVDGIREYKMDLFFACPGDIVVAKIDLKNGALAIVPDDWKNVVVTSHFAVYQPNRLKLLPEYLRRLIQTSFFKAHLWRNKVGAEGRKEVKLSLFESFAIPLPPLPTQRAIVRRWEEAQKEITEVRQRVERLEEEIPFRIYTELGTPKPPLNGPEPECMVLSWKDLERWSFNYLTRARQGLLGFSTTKYPIVPLSHCLVDTINGYCIKPVTGPTPHKMLKLSALTQAGLDLAETKFIKVPDRIAQRFSIRKGDLLICRSVGSYDHVAKCAFVEQDGIGILFPDIMIRIRLNHLMLPEYAREAIQTPLGRSYFQSNARTTVGMWKIGADDIRNFPIPLPPMDVQREIVRRLQEGRAVIAREREKARQLAAAVEQEVEGMILGVHPVPMGGE